VVAIGDSVKEVKVGDEVFGCVLFQELGMLNYLKSSERHFDSRLTGDRHDFRVCRGH
jgi:hypothetical protein